MTSMAMSPRISSPDELRRYALVVHCGACMLTRREMRRRVSDCRAAGVPVVNYGVLIAKLRGVDVPAGF